MQNPFRESTLLSPGHGQVGLLKCPECASGLLILVRTSLTKKITVLFGNKYARCLSCGHLFPLSAHEAVALEGREHASQIIDDDYYCSGCGYNLRSLKTRSRCPECGAEIKLAPKWPIQHKGARICILEWIIGLVFIFYSGLWFYRSGTATEIAAIIVGSAFSFVGVRGIRVQSTPLVSLRIYPERKVTGMPAVLLGITYLLLGIGAITLVGLAWKGVLNLKRFGIG